MKTMLKETAILFCITLISGFVLSLVYSVTKDPIAKQEEISKQKAYREVFAQAERFEEETDFDEKAATSALHLLEGGIYKDSRIVMTAQAFDRNNEPLGTVVTVTTGAGFGGDITLVIGIRTDETISGISVTEISETPGLGMRAPQVLAPQFEGKETVTKFIVTKTGALYPYEIDAISSATITSQAFTEAVNAAVAFLKYRGEELQNPDLKGGAANE